MSAAMGEWLPKHVLDEWQRKATAFDEIAARFFLYEDNEITADPWWSIVKRVGLGRYEILAGPFFNRKSAEDYRASHLYRYGEKSFVYCFSGNESSDYKFIRKTIKAVNGGAA